jgi:DNA primase
MKGETLSESELGRLKPIRGEGGRTWRAFCPFHGSDKQRSLRVDRQSGRFQCFACEAWGYMDWARENFKAEKYGGKRGLPGTSPPRSAPANPELKARGWQGPEPPGNVDDNSALPRPVLQGPASHSSGPLLPEALAEWLAEYQAALTGSQGEEYLEERKIPLGLAQRLGLGYARPGRWAHRDESGRAIRDWKHGRLVFPHTEPGGALVNLYGRALGERVPKSLRHDHLPGAKGYFNCAAMSAAGNGDELYVCEGPFDALSLLAADPRANAVAIFGVQGWRQDWASTVKRIVFALDADAAGEKAWRSLARQLVLRGKQVRILPAEAYGGAKDINEAWMLGTLDPG